MMEALVGGKFRIGRRLGGYLGRVLPGVNVDTGEEVAIKLEPADETPSLLLYESKVYRALEGGYGVPSVKWYGVVGDYKNVLVMDLLGPSLEDLKRFCGGRFSLKTILLLADQMLTTIEFIHSRNFLYRNFSSEHFRMGNGQHKNVCYIFGFDLAKKYRHRNEHIPFREGKKLVGCTRFASIHNHQGHEQGRRDDLESLGYVLMYLLQGSLPWQGQHATTKEEKYAQILEQKLANPPSMLCEGQPEEFQEYFAHCAGLGYEDTPNYAYLRRLFQELFVRQGYVDDGVYDWVLVEQQKQQARPVGHAVSARAHPPDPVV